MENAGLWTGWKPCESVFPGLMRVQRTRDGVDERALLQRILVPHRGDLPRLLSMPQEEQRQHLLTLQEETLARLTQLMTLRGQPSILECMGHHMRTPEAGQGLEFYVLSEDAQPLSTHLRSNVPDTAAVVSLGGHALTALASCEQRGVVHQRIGLDAFFVRGGRIKLGNFGMPSTRPLYDTQPSLLATYALSAPEYFSRRQHDAASDQYQLALMLYQLLNDGCPPFVEKGETLTEQALLKRLLGYPLPAPRQAPQALADVLLRALSHDPQLRYPDAPTLRAQWLIAAQEPAPVAQRAAIDAPRYRRKPIENVRRAPRQTGRVLRVAGTALGALALLVAATVFIHSTVSAGSNRANRNTVEPAALTVPPTLAPSTPEPASFSINLQNMGRMTVRDGANTMALHNGITDRMQQYEELVFYSVTNGNGGKDLYRVSPQTPTQAQLFMENVDRWEIVNGFIVYSLADRADVNRVDVNAQNHGAWLTDCTGWTLAKDTLYAQTNDALVRIGWKSTGKGEAEVMTHFPVASYKVVDGVVYYVADVEEERFLYRYANGKSVALTDFSVASAFDATEEGIYIVKWSGKNEPDDGALLCIKLSETGQAVELMRGVHPGQVAAFADGSVYVLTSGVEAATESPQPTATADGKAAKKTAKPTATPKSPTASPKITSSSTPSTTPKPPTASPSSIHKTTPAEEGEALVLTRVQPGKAPKAVSPLSALRFQSIGDTLWCTMEGTQLLCVQGEHFTLYAGTLSGPVLVQNGKPIAVCVDVEGQKQVLPLP